MSKQNFATAWASSMDLVTGSGHVNTGLAHARERTPTFVDSATTTALTLDGTQDVILCNCTTAAVTITLPAAPATTEPGARYVVVKTDSSGNAVTIARNGKPINGAASNDTLSTQHQEKAYQWSGDNTYGWHRTTRSA